MFPSFAHPYMRLPWAPMQGSLRQIMCLAHPEHKLEKPWLRSIVDELRFPGYNSFLPGSTHPQIPSHQMSEREELEQAIAALEAQRATLGDAVVDASLSALREKLAALDAPARPGQQRKQATILFMDVVGSTAIVRELDPEDNLAIMDTALRRLSDPVARFGGRVTRFMGDGFLALFGHPVASEHDPDNAVRAGLAILEEAGEYAREIEARWGVAEFDVRVGINTGLVVIGGDSEAENTVAGAAVNLAARLENAARPGTVLISHNTYQHVRGVFDLRPLQPIEAKGFAEPVPVYQVLRAKSRSFRTRRRGVEGVDTRLIGRESELKALQDAYHLVLADGERGMITVVGEAGLGKSRLLYEFENWVDLQPATITLFRGRARQETEHLPYSLFRDLFAFRFGIQDDDPAGVVGQKVVAGFRQTLVSGPDADEDDRDGLEMKAHFVGHLLGYGFGASPHIQPLSGDPQQLRDRALIYLVDFFKAAAGPAPVLILLEDLHWADDSSLDTLNRLAMATREQAVLLASATRPDLFQRRPHWMEGQPFHVRLDLRPLSRRDARLLTQEVLQKVVDIPDALRDLVVANAEGNPFFVEELVKMLLEEGVVVKGETTWQVMPHKLAGVRIPSTLTGVLQARLDRLPESERATLQRASVVGRVFWEQAVAHLDRPGEVDPDQGAVAEGLLALRSREMVYRRETSAFAGAQEYIFKHALLRDVTYERVLKSIRRGYHALAAEWLIQQSGDRVAEFSGLIADHLELAGRNQEALDYLRRAGEDASDRYAHEEAADFFGRALALVEEDDLENRYELLLAQEHAYDLLGRRDAQRQAFEALDSLVAGIDDKGRRATVSHRRGRLLSNIGDYTGAVKAAQRAIALAEEVGDYKVGSQAYLTWGRALYIQGRYGEAKTCCNTGLVWARRAGDLRAEGIAFNNLGLIATYLGDFDGARAYFEQAAELARQAGDRSNEAGAANNLGNVFSSRRDYESARSYYERSCKIARDIGDRQGEAVTLGNLGWIDAILGRYDDARRLLTETLVIDREISLRQSESYTLLNLALVAVNSGNLEPARAYAEQALEIARAIGHLTGEAYALTFLAHAALALGDMAGAEAAYDEAVAIHRRLEQEHLAMEPLAGSALIALESGDKPAATLLIEEILSYLDGGGTLDGAEEPLRVYFICYRVLHAVQDPQAIQVLTAAHDLLRAWAAKIQDEETKRCFLENVPWHREIVAAFNTQDS